jgi:hypothetical protein
MRRRMLLPLASAIALAIIGASVVAYAATIRTVHINDQCDPATFNAAIGPGTCTGQNGGVPFDVFLNPGCAPM